MKKIIIIVIAILLLGVLFQCGRDKNRNVNTKIDGFIIDLKDSTYSYKSSLSINGEFKEVSGEPIVFLGNFSFNNIPSSIEKFDNPIKVFMATKKKYQPSVIPRTDYAIDIFSSGDFNEILMTIYPINESDTTLYFVGPANSVVEAKKLVNKLVKNTKYSKALYFEN